MNAREREIQIFSIVKNYNVVVFVVNNLFKTLFFYIKQLYIVKK